VDWDSADFYSLSISNLTEKVVASFSGSMSTGSVSMLGAAVFGAGTDETLVFDEYQVIPEPATALLLLLGAGLVFTRKRRKNNRLG